MPFWKWILCLLGGLIIFLLLDAFAMAGVVVIPIQWAKIPAAIVIGILGLLKSAVSARPARFA